MQERSHNFPPIPIRESELYNTHRTMQRQSHRKTFTIHINEASDSELIDDCNHNHDKILSFSAMKLFNRFRKIFMRLILTLPSSAVRRGSERRRKKGGGGGGERFEPPKMSCSSYYSSHSHYSEAIADCIEFFNKSSAQSQEDQYCEEADDCHDCFYV